MSIQLLVILVPVLLGFMGFAVDLGRMYLVRAELNQAAGAMAMAAAARLNGTEAGLVNAPELTPAGANTYNFGSRLVGQVSGVLDSVIQTPVYYANITEALSGNDSTGVSGATAKHVTINLTGEAPLVFWSLLPLGQTRKTTIAATATAGISAPLCTACGIEPFAIQAAVADDADFGFTVGNTYTLYMQCTGAIPAAVAPGTSGRIPYLIIDGLLNNGVTEEQQLFRIGAQGLIGSEETPGQACVTANNVRATWSSITALRACGVGTAVQVQYALCGVASRFADPTAITTCNNIPDFGTIAAAYTPDTNVDVIADYASEYNGSNARVITVPVVQTLALDGTMLVLGFRQFLLQPTNAITPPANVPTDPSGRFAAIYLGSVAPIKAGTVGGTCGLTSGPGKVVLHR